jgi:predicted acyl esterase
VGLAYTSEPLTEDSVLAGNPFALLRLSSDQPGGIVGVHVLSLGPDFDCSDSSTFDVVALGAADLRFHQGNLHGEPFPVGKPTEVRVDVWDNAQMLREGSRVAVVVSYGEAFPGAFGSSGQPYAPRITVHGDVGERASHIVLPITEGTAGGTVRTLEYPPRPFAGQG